MFKEDAELESDFIAGVIGKNGPIHLDDEVDPAMVRYLANLVQASLPPPPVISDPASVKSDARQTLGFGLGRRKKDHEPGRRSSWTNLGWVPGLGGSTLRSSTPTPTSAPATTSRTRESRAATAKEDPTITAKKETRWPSLGIGGLTGLGDAMGTMGTALGFGSSPMDEPVTKRAEPALHDEAVDVQTTAIGTDETSTSTIQTTDWNQPSTWADETAEQDRSQAGNEQGREHSGNVEVVEPASSHVEQSPVALPDLRAAVQADTQVELTWDGRGVWVRVSSQEEGYVKRRLSWIIVGFRVTCQPYILIHSARQRSPICPPSAIRHSTMDNASQRRNPLTLFKTRNYPDSGAPIA